MIIDTIIKRRSVFPASYNDKKITKTEIEKILESANWAPTHKRTEPWRFKVFHGASQKKFGQWNADKYKETTGNFSEFTYAKFHDNPIKAGCVIAICMQRDPKESLPEWEEIAATAMAVQNMWLTAHDLNIGAYWASPGTMNYLNEFAPMEESEKCLGYFFMGKYDAELPEGTRKTPIEDKTVWL